MQAVPRAWGERCMLAGRCLARRDGWTRVRLQV